MSQDDRLVVNAFLKPGMVLLFPFGKNAKITKILVGREYVTLWFEGLPKTRVMKYDESLVEGASLVR